MRNPHFDDNRVIWKDEYSGLYLPVSYESQFDHQWRLFLEQKTGFTDHVGVETEDIWIDDRIYDLTGSRGLITQNAVQSDEPLEQRDRGGRQTLDLQFSTNHFRDKRCLDAACGAGRWTRALMALGADVKSIDISEYGLKSVRRFNKDTERLDLFDIQNNPNLHKLFDFTICWGVVMCTHDPRLAFENIAKTVKQGGELYVMVYAPNYHNSKIILEQRKHYHKNLKTFEEKLAYAYEISDCPENTISYLDMLNTFYNWVVEEETIHNWFYDNGFSEVITLNTHEKYPVAYHVLGRKRDYARPLYDDYGIKLENKSHYEPENAISIGPSFDKEKGFAWKIEIGIDASQSDSLNNLSRSNLVLLEDGIPLWHRHSAHDDIRSIGKGCYSHWHNYLLFSTTDNTDPNTNNRVYKIVISET